MKKKILVSLRLPNGKDKRFSVQAGKNWKADLRAQIQDHFPNSAEVEFVDEPREKPLFSGKSFSSGVMFELRKNYYVLGHITARIG